MELLTTVIGAFPKPDYLKVGDWFRGGGAMERPTDSYARDLETLGEQAETLFRRAAADVIADQVACGIDIPTDGEVRRENYIHYHCRHLDGFDFENLTHRVLRNGAYEAWLPTVAGPVSARDVGFLVEDWRAAQATTARPVKVTLPGPLTICDTTADTHYGDPKAEGADLAAALNQEILALAEAGCRYIQVDEPLFARKPQEALDFGIENLNRCFHGVPKGTTRVMHMCCGYPDHLDDEDYVKADPRVYFELAKAVDGEAEVDQVSLEDAHCHNDLGLLDLYQTKTVILGVVAVARSRVESQDEIRERLNAALAHIDADRLMAAPDCGLGFLGRELAMKKLANLCQAAKHL